MYPELKLAKALRTDELGHVTAPVYAVSQLKTAWLGHIRIRGYDAALAACTDRSSSNKDTRQHGFDRLRAQVENATLVLVLDKSVAPTSPAYHPVNGQWEVSHHVRNNSARDRLGYQLQALQRQQREQLALQSQNQPSSAEPQSEPASGPGNRVASLGPHVGGGGPATTDNEKSKSEIENLMKSTDPTDRQMAIDKSIQFYGINMTGISSVKYDPSLSDNGVTSRNGVVRLGTAAFATTSPGWLGSTLGHEIEAHIQGQALQGNWWTDDQGTAMQEVQAYDYELANANRYGLSKNEIQELKLARNDYYRDLNQNNKVLADAGNFSTYKP